MNKTTRGGRVFPAATEHHIHQEGMALRDLIAIKAMQSFFTASLTGEFTVTSDGIKTISKAAYIAADEMLKAREA